MCKHCLCSKLKMKCRKFFKSPWSKELHLDEQLCRHHRLYEEYSEKYLAPVKMPHICYLTSHFYSTAEHWFLVRPLLYLSAQCRCLRYLLCFCCTKTPICGQLNWTSELYPYKKEWRYPSDTEALHWRTIN